MTRFNMPISDRAVEDIMSVPGVVSVGEGIHEGQRAVIIGIEDASVADDPRLPGTVEGLPVVAEVENRPGFTEVGNPLVPEDGGSLPQPVTETTAFRRRPVPPGVSIGHTQTTAGTSSFVAHDGEQAFQLSNSHVLAMRGQAAIGDDILQPGPVDDGTAEDRVGDLAGHVDLSPTDNVVDLAWYEPDEDVGLTTEIFGLGEPDAAPRDPQVGDTVRWAGRTTGQGSATVDRANVAVEVGDTRRVFTQQFRIDAPLLPGDSGSPMVLETQDGLAPAGMGFASTDSNGYCNYISNVIAASEMDLGMPAPDDDTDGANGSDGGDGGDTGPTRAGLSPEVAAVVLLGVGVAYIVLKRRN